MGEAGGGGMRRGGRVGGHLLPMSIHKHPRPILITRELHESGLLSP